MPIDSNYYALELFTAAADLIKAEEFDDVNKAFERVIRRAQSLASEKFKDIAAGLASQVVEELREDSIRAQGGL